MYKGALYLSLYLFINIVTYILRKIYKHYKYIFMSIYKILINCICYIYIRIFIFSYKYQNNSNTVIILYPY